MPAASRTRATRSSAADTTSCCAYARRCLHPRRHTSGCQLIVSVVQVSMALHRFFTEDALSVCHTAAMTSWSAVLLQAAVGGCGTPEVRDRLLLILELLTQQVLQGGRRLTANETQRVLQLL